MKEIERIKESGVFNKDFFKKETRNDFLVDEKRKEIWAIGIDLLFHFDDICRKHNLRYWLAYGTLLGAIRHNGFIPWDDDIDVCMLRDDYDKLLLLSDEFKNPYFLQTPYTDKGYYYSYCKLRNSNTTAFSKNFSYHFCSNDCNSGMSLDVFCIDKWENSIEGEKLYDEIKALIVNNSTAMKLANPAFEADERVANYNGADPMETYETIQRLSKTYINRTTDIVSMPTITAYGFHRDIFSIDDFSKTDYHNFEGFRLPVPIGYDRILSVIYGDYKVFPPVEARGKWHSAIVDANTPYKDYYVRFRNGENLWPTV